jgi:hypothetical protein
MTQSQYVIRRKLKILELGGALGNISDACLSYLGLYLRYCRSDMPIRLPTSLSSVKLNKPSFCFFTVGNSSQRFYVGDYFFK